MKNDAPWPRTAVGAAVVTSVSATAVVGASFLVVAYRLFHGPGTGQLFFVWAAGVAGCALLGHPLALAAGLVAGVVARSTPSRGRARHVAATAVILLFVLLYAAFGLVAVHLRLGSVFELSQELLPVASATGAAVGLLTWRQARARHALKARETRSSDTAAGGPVRRRRTGREPEQHEGRP